MEGGTFIMPGYILEGYKPKIEDGDSTFIAPSADLIGKIILGASTGIWFGAVLRGDNEPITIGEGSNIQDQTVIHTEMGVPATIGKGCTIGHRALLHGCTIGDNCLIGMGAIVMNHAEIGPDSIVGAGALITEGKKFLPRSLIFGNPAVFKRFLNDKEIASIRKSAVNYIENARRFKSALEILS